MQASIDDPRIIKKYIQSGGQIKELIGFLTKLEDPTNKAHISYIFQLIQYVLIELLNEETSLYTTVKSAQGLVKTHKKLFVAMIESNLIKYKKIALKLMTALVTLDASFSGDLLTVFNNLPDECLTALTKPTKENVNDSDGEPIRTVYVHFVMSFLIEGDINRIRTLVEKSHLITSIFYGLIHDESNVVTLFIDSLTKFIVKEMNISKTQKLLLFNEKMVKILFNLYTWKGPRSKTPSEEEKIAVQTSIHQFFMIYLVSRKFGCAFSTLNNIKAKHNPVQKNILMYLDKPWDSEYHSELTIEILKSSPDLMGVYEKRFHSWFEKTDEEDHVGDVKKMKFIARLIESLQPNIISYGIKNLRIRDTSSLILSICLSAEVLQKSGKMIKSDHFACRQVGIETLLVMITQTQNYVDSIVKWGYYQPNDIRTLKFNNIDQIFDNSPTVDVILDSLYSLIITGSTITDEILEYCNKTLDLLLVISRTIPSFIEKTSTILNYLKIIHPIYEYASKMTGKFKPIEVEIKALNLLLVLEPHALSNDDQIFYQIFQSLPNIYLHGTDEYKRDTKVMLLKIFRSTGLFENGLYEIDVWIEALNLIPADCLTAVIDFVIKIFKVMKANPQEGEKAMTDALLKINQRNEAARVENLAELFFNIENGITLKGVMDVPNLSRFFVVAMRDVDAKESSALEYLENVTMLLFHYLPNPEIIEHFIAKKSLKISDYIRNWVKKGNPVKSSFNSSWRLDRLSEAIIDGSCTFADVYKTSDEELERFPVNGDVLLIDKSLEFNATKVIISINTTLFHLIELGKLNKLTNQTADVCLTFVNNYLEILHQQHEGTADNQSLITAIKSIYCHHYFLLQNFYIWSDGGDASVVREGITRFLIGVTKKINSFQSGVAEFNDFTALYRNKIINQIKTLIKKTVSDGIIPKNENFIESLSVFRLDGQNLIEILTDLVDLMKTKYFIGESDGVKTIYYHLIVYFITRLSELRVSSLSKEILMKLTLIYVNLNALDGHMEEFEESYLKNLVEFPHLIEYVSDDLFKSFFTKPTLTKQSTIIATLLLERKPTLQTILNEHLPEMYKKKELIYSLLNVANFKEIKLEILVKIYNEYKAGIMKTIDKPNKAGVIFRTNLKTSIKLIEYCMPPNECIDFCKKQIKFDTIELRSCQLIKTIHLIAIKTSRESTDNGKMAYLNFINNWLQMFVNLLQKTDQIDVTKVNSMILIVSNWLNLQKYLKGVTYEKITTSSVWKQFCRLCLKLGLQIVDDKPENDYSILIRVMAILCDRFYAEKSNAEELETFFEMTVGHSEFFNIILNTKEVEKNRLKMNLVYLVFVMVTKNNNNMNEKHIPVFLSGYTARLNRTDRYLLALLQYYEVNGVNLKEYRPFVWGEQAASFYSLKDAAKTENLLNDEPINLIISLIEKEVIEETLDNFPIWRRLDTIKQLPEMNFTDVTKNIDYECCDVTAGYLSLLNDVEKVVESKAEHFDKSILKVLPQKADFYDNVYDPAFFVPLMTFLFSPENYASVSRVAANGGIGLIWGCLSSLDLGLRVAAANVLLRYKEHLESK